MGEKYFKKKNIFFGREQPFFWVKFLTEALLCKITSFPIFNVVNNPKLGFLRKKNENLGESPTVREEHPFLCQNSETFIF